MRTVHTSAGIAASAMAAIAGELPQDMQDDPGRPVSSRFQFRFVVRGEQANTLVGFAIRSLRHCHPNAGIVLVDANDESTLTTNRLPAGGDIAVVHVPPEEDEIANIVGRGSPRHLYYWRHSPQVLESVPRTDRYAVYSDADIIFLRPLDLASLLRPLARGRIAAVVDESMLDYGLHLATIAHGPVSGLLPVAAASGPLLQSGLLFTNPCDDGALFELFWDLAVRAAREGVLADLPWNDMSVITALLSRTGPLWERLLALDQGWNYITDGVKDPGIFGRAAHYGGRRAKELLLGQAARMFPTTMPPGIGWGTVAEPGSESMSLGRGPWRRRPQHPVDSRAAPRQRLSIPLPFCLTWHVPPGVTNAQVTGQFSLNGYQHVSTADAVLFVDIDGRLAHRVSATEGHIDLTVEVIGAETITIIGVGTTTDQVDLQEPFAPALHTGRCSPKAISPEARS